MHSTYSVCLGTDITGFKTQVSFARQPHPSHLGMRDQRGVQELDFVGTLKQIFYGQHILEICASPSLKSHQGVLDFGTPQLMEVSSICHEADVFLHEGHREQNKATIGS